MPRNRVLLDQWSLIEPGSDRGLGRYALEIRQALVGADRWEIEALHGATGGDGMAVGRIGKAIKAARDADIYHAMTVFHLPVAKQMPWLCSIQDVIPLDLPDYRRLGVRTRLAFAAARRSDMILANSRYTADRIMDRLGVSSRKVRIASLPVADSYHTFLDADESAKRSLEFDRPFLVALADGRVKDPRKRYQWINQLAEALRNLEILMVVTGRGINDEMFPSCVVIEPRSDAELSQLYGSASGFFYSSAYEGQGLPPLEAMASGAPVLAFRNTSVTEMVGTGGILLDDPCPWEDGKLDTPMPTATVNQLLDAVRTLVHDEQSLREARARARAQANRLTREGLKDRLLDAYDATLRGV